MPNECMEVDFQQHIKRTRAILPAPYRSYWRTSLLVIAVAVAVVLNSADVVALLSLSGVFHMSMDSFCTWSWSSHSKMLNWLAAGSRQMTEVADSSTLR